MTDVDLSEARYRQLREREAVLLALLEENDEAIAEHNREAELEQARTRLRALSAERRQLKATS